MNKIRVKRVLRMFLLAFVILEFIDKYIYFVSPNLDYYIFFNNKQKYDVAKAYIKESDRLILIPGKFEPFVSFVKHQVDYEINGIKYVNYIYTYPEAKQGEQIEIAYNKQNAKDIKRCVQYNLSSQDKFDIFITIIVVIIVLILYMINEHCIKSSLIKEKEHDNYESENQGIKNQILEICNDIPIQSQENIELEIEVNIDFVWCLENLIDSPKIQNIVSLKKDSNGEFEFIKQTLCLQKQGLPNGYHVIAKIEQYYLCGHVESPRLYFFSVPLGITNTKYSNIFEYILERLQN